MSKKKQNFKVGRKEFNPLNNKQKEYLLSIKQKTITFGIGPAGTGKTFCAILSGVEEILKKEKKKLIFIRPIIECGRGIGFLKGSVEEKIKPFFVPLHENLKQIVGSERYAALIKKRLLMDIPIEHVRGLTWDDSFIILDEAQNATSHQIKTVLTRLGNNSKLVINGDDEQSDIGNKSGLIFAQEALKGMRQLGSVTFTEDDIVRNPLIKQILIRWRKKELG